MVDIETPLVKVTLDGTDYTSEVIGYNVKLRENNYNVATITLDNYESKFYTSLVNTFDVVKVYVKDASDVAYTQLFEGWARDLLPTHDRSGEILTLGCKGYASAFESTHCNKDYGLESTLGSSQDELTEILSHIFVNYIAKSFGDWATGHSWNVTYISDNFDDNILTYINNPYRSNLNTINHLCTITSAIEGGSDPASPTSAGPHWIEKHSGGVSPYFLLGRIGDHTAGAGGTAPSPQWPDWWNTDQAGSTLAQGEDFVDYRVIDKSEEFSNSVVLITDFRRPAYDYWTEDSGGSALWGNDGLTSITDSAAQYIVGSHSLLFSPAVPAGDGYYPYGCLLAGDAAAAQKDVSVGDGTKFSVGQSVHLYDDTPDEEDATIASIVANTLTMVSNLTNNYTVAQNARITINAQWDMTKWGSEKSIPTLNFYYWKSNGIVEASTYVKLCTTDYDNDYFWSNFTDIEALGYSTHQKWIHVSLPIGPYWRSYDTTTNYRWAVGDGTPLWTSINSICFKVFDGAGTEQLYIDDLHFSGKIARQAYDSGNITANNEWQKVLISRSSMDDSCIASDDTGDAGRLCKAELFRRIASPYTIQFSTPLRKNMLAGQKTHIHAGLQSDHSTYTVNADMRMLQVEHNVQMNQGAWTTVSATTDLYNSFPMSAVDAWALQREYTLLNSKEAMNMRAGSEVDLLIPIMKRDYT